MKQSVHKPSLLSYLGPEKGKLQLQISLSTQDPDQLEKDPDPFLTICDSDPLARLVEAHIVSDTGRPIKRISLFVQKDRYQFIRSGVWPLNNRDLEHCWQRAFDLWKNQTDSAEVYPLGTQGGDDGVLLPFQSLFFCKKRRLFFHPPCPGCGQPLELCIDDALLKRVNLKSYATSLSRYLYCPNCHDQGQTDVFFVPIRDAHDPSEVKDCHYLIQQYSLLADQKMPPRDWPCGNCSHFEQCHGDQQLSAVRMVAFAFYPFYMFVFEAPSINYFEFVALVSGAERTDIEQRLIVEREPGRLHCLQQLPSERAQRWFFFAKTDSKFILEVLYLKLTFIGEFIRSMQDGSLSGDHPDLRFSIGRLWIRFCGQGKLMPALWNFKVKPIDIGQNVAKNQFFPKLSIANPPHLFFLVWFYTLLTNSRQEITDVFLALGQAMEEVPIKFDNRLESYAQDRAESVFAINNILWVSSENCSELIPPSLWDRTLGLGWRLLDSISPGGSEEAEWRDFWREYESLRDDIHQQLFYSALPEPVLGAADGDEKIHQILEKIIDKERDRLAAEQSPLFVQVADGDIDGFQVNDDDDATRPNLPTETTVIGDLGNQTTMTGCDQAEPDVPPAQGAQEALSETIILDAPPIGEGVSQAMVLPDDTTENNFPKPPGDDEFLSETIIIDPKKRKGPRSSQ